MDNLQVTIKANPFQEPPKVSSNTSPELETKLQALHESIRVMRPDLFNLQLSPDVVQAAQDVKGAVNNFAKTLAERFAPVMQSAVSIWKAFYNSLPEERRQAIEAEIRRDKIRERNRRKYQRMMERRR